MKKALPRLLAPMMALALVLGLLSCGGGSNDGPKNIGVASISLDKASMSLLVGESGNLAATILPADATNKNVSWSSSNPSVANVSGAGLTAIVTAASAGPATITVTTADGNKTATCVATCQPEKCDYEDCKCEPCTGKDCKCSETEVNNDPYDTDFALIKALVEFFPKIQGRNLSEKEQAKYSDELKEVFVKAYARDSYSKNLPFSSEEIRKGLSATKYNFPLLHDLFYNGVAGITLGLLNETESLGKYATVHETGHHWGLGEGLTTMLSARYRGYDIEVYGLEYGTVYHILLAERVGDEKIWSLLRSQNANEEYGEIFTNR